MNHTNGPWRRVLWIGFPALAVALFSSSEAVADRALPEYTVETPSLKEPVSFLVGARVSMLLRPASAVSPPVAVSAYWERAGEAKPWKTTSSISKEGTVELVGLVDAPFGGVEANIAFVVAQANAGPAPVPSKCLAPGCRVVRKTVRLVRPILPSPNP